MRHRTIKNTTSKIISLIMLVAMVFLPVQQVHAIAAEKITATYPYYGFVEDPDSPWESVYDALDETDTIEYSDDRVRLSLYFLF